MRLLLSTSVRMKRRALLTLGEGRRALFSPGTEQPPAWRLPSGRGRSGLGSPT